MAIRIVNSTKATLCVGAKHFPISLFGSYSRLAPRGRSTKAISSNYLNAFGKVASLVSLVYRETLWAKQV